ncbi:MAG: flagellar export protein FliJ [Nevskiales bacterium]|nr:flagellar export protein FliJ [Nevskiales bacterium]
MSSKMTSQRLAPIQQIAQTKEEDAAKRLLEAQRKLSERELRLHELQRYVAEYENGPPASTPLLLMNRQQFLGRLREAVQVQMGLVEQARRDCDAIRGNWLLKRRDVSTLDQLSECYRRKEALIDERRDQQRLDEFALRRYATRTADDLAEVGE